MKKAYTDETYDIQWKVENVTERRIEISLNFSDPFTISQYSEKDSLIVKFIKGAHIVRNDDQLEKVLQDQLKDHSEDENLDFA
jgi:hypothetical protein